MPTQSPFCRLSIANEKGLYLNYVYKHNLHGKVHGPFVAPPLVLPLLTCHGSCAQTQGRLLFLTNEAVYDLDTASPNTKLKRRIRLLDIGSLTLHEPDGQARYWCGEGKRQRDRAQRGAVCTGGVPCARGVRLPLHPQARGARRHGRREQHEKRDAAGRVQRDAVGRDAAGRVHVQCGAARRCGATGLRSTRLSDLSRIAAKIFGIGRSPPPPGAPPQCSRAKCAPIHNQSPRPRVTTLTLKLALEADGAVG